MAARRRATLLIVETVGPKAYHRLQPANRPGSTAAVAARSDAAPAPCESARSAALHGAGPGTGALTAPSTANRLIRTNIVCASQQLRLYQLLPIHPYAFCNGRLDPVPHFFFPPPRFSD